MKKILFVFAIMLIAAGTMDIPAYCSSPKCPIDNSFGTYQKVQCDGWGCRDIYKFPFGHYFYCD
jgi:hypothetical protein